MKLWLKATENALKSTSTWSPLSSALGSGNHESAPRGKNPSRPSHLLSGAGPSVWNLRQAESIGPHCYRLLWYLYSDKVLDYLRAAQEGDRSHGLVPD